jgi:hypothetical protein
MIAWWDSPTPVDPDFIRRQRKDAAGIPLRVWLAVLDQALPANLFGDLHSHNPFWENPRGVAEVVNAFLNTPL